MLQFHFQHNKANRCTGLTEIERKHKGSFSEKVAIVELMKMGFDVFENVSVTGYADLVAWKEGQPPIFIDVKTVSASKDKNTGSGAASSYYSFGKLKPKQRENGVVLLLVYPDESVSFDLPPFGRCEKDPRMLLQ